MMMQLPKEFTEISFDGMLVLFAEPMPHLAPLLWEHLRMSETDARERIAKQEQAGLVKFAVSPDRDPSVFIAPKGAYMFYRDFEFATKLVEYFDTQGKFDSNLGKIVSTKVDTASLIYRIQTPEGDLGVASPVAKKLLEMGLLTVDAEGQYHGPSKVQVMQWTEEHGICDFCSSSNPSHVEIVPEFELVPASLDQDSRPTDSIGGWATCETCHTMIAENRRTDLLRRGIEASKGGKFTAAALKGLHAKFWAAWDSKVDAAGIGAALLDFIEDKISPEKTFVNPKLQQKTARIEAIRRMTGLTPDEMNALGKGDVLYKGVAAKLSAWRKKFGADGYAGAQRVAEMLNASENRLAPHGLPHWQVALDQKVEAVKAVQMIENIPPGSPLHREIDWMDLKEDLQALRMSEVYSFNVDTMHAIMVGSQSLPHDATLKSIEVPNVRAGWFWFAEPFPVASSPAVSDTTAALLWSWDMSKKIPTLRFSAYVVDDKHTDPRRDILPSTKWLWPIDLTFHEMIGFNTQLYQNAYGPNGPMKDKPFLIGEEGTMKVVAEMSLFFLMACLWFRQTVPGTKKKIDPVLTQTDGHIERHARKRAQKDLKLAEAPRVRVIALRKTEAVAVEHTEADGTKRHLKVRFVVKGHPRWQRCGPGLADKKLIWIAPHPKGPADAPFKDSGPTVFAVVR